MVNLIFALWVGFAAWRGYRAGWLSMVLGLLAFVLAYLVCFLGTGALAQVFRAQGLNALYAFALAALLLFCGTTFLVAALPRWLLARSGYLRGSKSSFGGALLGLVSGCVSGLLILWVYGLLKAALAMPMEATRIEKQANKIVGAVVEQGMEAAGTQGVGASATKVLFSEPETFVTSLKSLAGSPELKAFFSNAQVQNLMNNNDVDGLVNTPAFDALASHEGMQVFLAKQHTSSRLARRELATELTRVWQRIQVLKNDPEIIQILNDDEVKKLIEQNNPVALLHNKKIQILIERVMDEELSSGNSAPVGKLEVNSDAEVTKNENVDIYEWRDDQGDIQFSDYESIPLEKRREAVQVGGTKKGEISND